MKHFRILFLIAFCAILLFPVGCSRKFDPQKNRLPKAFYGWWAVEVPSVGFRPAHVIYVCIDKTNATMIDIGRGFGVRASGVYNFHQGSDRKQGQFDLQWNGSALRTDTFIGTWSNAMQYKKDGKKPSLTITFGGRQYPMGFRRDKAGEDRIIDEANHALDRLESDHQQNPLHG
jgi:hypothetical protein